MQAHHVQMQQIPVTAGHVLMAPQQQQPVCHFPHPAPKRCYCHPAAFTSLDGRAHHRIVDAYGNSRPCRM